jgi:hypothetical protein
MMEFFNSALGLLTIIGAVIAAYGIYKYAKATDVQSELKAKDGAIITQNQVNDANEQRITQLEGIVEKMESELVNMRRNEAELKGKIEVLERYSAPEAIERFEAQQKIIVEILQGIQKQLEKE